MKQHKAVVVSILAVAAVVVAGVAIYTNHAAKASVAGLPDALNSLPADCQFVFGMNVQKFVASPIYTKLRQQQNPAIGSDLSQFTLATGVDPARDINYLVAGGRAKEKAKGQGVIIVVGTFNKDAITNYIRSKATPIEQAYGGATVLMIPEPNTAAVNKGLVFLSDREMALGDLESLKAVLDVRASGNGSILFNPTMAPLINGINPEEMLWFAGNAAGVMANAPLSTPLASGIPAVQAVVGTFNVTDSLTGQITATASTPDSAVKLADILRGLVALGQLSGDKNPELKMLLGGLTISQTASQVSLALNFPAELIQKLEQVKKFP